MTYTKVRHGRATSGLLPLVALLSVGACSGGPEPGSPGAVGNQMTTHFDLAVGLRDHAVSGDLTRFRSTARALSTLEPTADLPADVFLQFGPLRYEAEVAADARTVEAAARGAAEVAATCGDCHQQNDVSLPPSIPGPAVSRPVTDPSLHMERLSRVTQRLWAGLVGANEADWQAGATDLIDAGGLPGGLEGMVPDDLVRQAAGRLVRLAEEAAGTDDPRYRVRALGEIWGTCAECHQRVGS
jgi:mono/diheme cytochrome c family protein